MKLVVHYPAFVIVAFACGSPAPVDAPAAPIASVTASSAKPATPTTTLVGEVFRERYLKLTVAGRGYAFIPTLTKHKLTPTQTLVTLCFTEAEEHMKRICFPAIGEWNADQPEKVDGRGGSIDVNLGLTVPGLCTSSGTLSFSDALTSGRVNGKLDVTLLCGATSITLRGVVHDLEPVTATWGRGADMGP